MKDKQGHSKTRKGKKFSRGKGLSFTTQLYESLRALESSSLKNDMVPYLQCSPELKTSHSTAKTWKMLEGACVLLQGLSAVLRQSEPRMTPCMTALFQEGLRQACYQRSRVLPAIEA